MAKVKDSSKNLIIIILPVIFAFLSVAFIPEFLVYSVFIYCWAVVLSIFLALCLKFSSEYGGIGLILFTIFYGFAVILFLKPQANFFEFFYLLPLLILLRFYIKETVRKINGNKKIYGIYMNMTIDIFILLLIAFLLYTNYSFTNCIGNYLSNTTNILANTSIKC